MADTHEDRLLKTGEVAALFGVTHNIVAKWVQAGRLDAVRTPGGQLRFRESVVLALRAQIAGS